MKTSKSHLGFLAGMSLCYLAPPAFADEKVYARFVLSGFRDTCERLRSGHLTCHRLEVRDCPGTPLGEGALDSEIWFDYAGDLGRYECSYREFYLGTTGPKPDQPIVGGTYARISDRAILWLRGWEQVRIQSLATEPPRGIWMPDVRITGLSNFGSFQRGWSLDRAMSDMTTLTDKGTVKVDRPNESLVRITWDYADFINVMDFDVLKGYLPIKFEEYAKDDQGNKSEVTEWGSTEYIFVNQVWVPSAATISTGRRGKASSRFEVSYDWKSVNQPLNTELFMTRGLGIPDGTHILDIRDGKRPVNLGKIGDMTPSRRLALMEPPVPRRWWQAWPTYAGAATLFVALAIGVRYWLRRRKVQA